jgi:hypothetical protein
MDLILSNLACEDSVSFLFYLLDLDFHSVF